MPFDVMYHCMLTIPTDANVIFIGGYKGLGEYSDQTWSYNMDLGEWTLFQAKLGTGRSWLTCGLIKDSSDLDRHVIVVSGGKIQQDPTVYTDTTELLDVSNAGSLSADWQDGPAMPVKAAQMSRALSPDKTVLFAAGGRTYGDQVLESIYQFSCWERKCQWLVWNQKLSIGRWGPIILILPKNDETCVEFY